MKNNFILFLFLFFLFFISCASTPKVDESEIVHSDRPYHFKAVSLLESIFYSYENQNYFQFRNLLNGAVLDRYHLIQSSIRQEFRDYDYIKVIFNIDKIEQSEDYLQIRFNWRKQRRATASGTFRPSDDTQRGLTETRGFSVFTFNLTNDKLVQIKGDSVFGLAGN